MHAKKHKSGWLFTAAIGSGLALVVLGILVALLTGLILNGRIGEGSSERIVYGMHIVSILIGTELAKRICANNEMRIPITVGITYAVLCMVAGMMLEGTFRNMLLHIIAICSGVAISCALCIHRAKRSGKRKKGVW